MIKLNPTMTIDLLRLAVAERGEDHRAERNPATGNCMYVIQTENGPTSSCIVGHVFHYLGLPLTHDLLRANMGAHALTCGLENRHELEIDESSREILGYAQQRQDGLHSALDPDGNMISQPWGQVVRDTIEYARKNLGLDFSDDLHTDLTVAQVRELASV